MTIVTHDSGAFSTYFKKSSEVTDLQVKQEPELINFQLSPF